MAFGRIAVYADDTRLGPSEIDAPGHTNIDLGASWTPNRRIEIRGQLRNLLNQDYYASPDPRWVPAPGFNGSVTVSDKVLKSAPGTRPGPKSTLVPFPESCIQSPS